MYLTSDQRLALGLEGYGSDVPAEVVAAAKARKAKKAKKAAEPAPAVVEQAK
jgi:hypothetical protein